jgi:3-dehydroquinate dehydratase / shikimate dehydrogenase
MLFVSINSLPNSPKILELADGIELRLDLFEKIEIALIEEFLKSTKKPIMFTLRPLSQGGAFKGSEVERQNLILKLLILKPDFFDLEHDIDEDYLKKTLNDHPYTKFILSHHEMKKKLNEKELHEIYFKMAKHKVFGYKIAVYTSKTSQALEMLLFLKNHPKLSVICMGEKVSFSRVLGAILGNQLNYCSMDDNQKVAPGQLSVLELFNTYRYQSLNHQTKLYGLIGNPIEMSQGHLYHNNVFREKNINAVYVKMLVEKDELFIFLDLAKKIGFKGLSVTMPLKESVFSLTTPVDLEAKAIKAVNTLLFKNNSLLSTNTDGKGALDAIEKKTSIKNKKLVIIGAGGAARAIAFEAKSRGAILFILNRSLENLKKLSQELGCKFGSLNDLPTDCDILINCIPEIREIDLSNIKPFTLVMDIVYNPRETLFLQRAKKQGATVIYGEEMFWNQAAAQTSFWF